LLRSKETEADGDSPDDAAHVPPYGELLVVAPAPDSAR
jgi:hypothetical protein